MFISWQSYEGLEITVFSFKEVCKFLLQQGIPYILSKRFYQDDLENYFGKQQAIGEMCDNPTVRNFGYNDNTIKSQFSVRPIAGNVQEPFGKFNRISDEPLPKRKKMLCPKNLNYKPNSSFRCSQSKRKFRYNDLKEKKSWQWPSPRQK